jgi:hypothetical protein
MAFTAAELSSIANAALDFHFKGQPFAQSIQDKPLLAIMEGARKTFPGGKGDITYPVKGKYDFEGAAPGNGHLTGYTHDDQVAYGTFAGIERARYPWREVHTGWNVTYTELKIDGISVVDRPGSDQTTEHEGREVTAISNIMQDKVTTFAETSEKELNGMLWGDGTTDPLAFLGLRYFITATPAVGLTGGIDRATNAWWRNRFKGGLTAGASGATNVAEVMHQEMRQLGRYGSKPNKALCGSAFLDLLVTEIRSKGYYTDAGWSKPDGTNIEIADVRLGNLRFIYDPTLDDLGGVYIKSCYMFPTQDIFLYAMADEWAKDHTPARPHDRYVLYKARTYTGQMIARRLNGAGLYQVA